MATIAELRAGLGAEADQYTDEQLYNAYKAVAGSRYRDEKTFNQAVGWDPEWDFGRGMRIAGRGTLAAGAGAGAALADTFGLTGARDSALAYGREQQQKAFQLGRRSDDVDNFTQDPLSFLSSAAGQGVAYAVPSVLGGGLGALGARAVGMGALRGAAAGSFATNLGQETGGIYNELAEQGRYEPGRALAFGLPAAALDTVSEAIPFLGGAAKGGVLRRIAGGFAKQAGVEAATETGQTAIERAGAYKDLTGDEAWHEYRNAAAVGAVGGGMFGGAMGLMPPKRQAEPIKPPVNDAPGQSTDLLSLGEIPSMRGQVQTGFDPNPNRLNDFTPAGPRPGSRVLQMPEAPGDVTPEWGLSQGAGQPREPGLDFSGAYQAAGEPPLFSASGRRGPDPMGQMPGVDMPPLVADQGGAVAGGPYFDSLTRDVERGDPSRQALALSGGEDPGTALARERYLQQTRQAAQQRQTAEAVQAKAAEQRAEADRVRQILGGKIKPGSIQVQLLQELEAQRDAGLMDQTAFEGDAALLSNGRLGDVKKRIKERANAAGAGTDGRTGAADLGGGAGNQRAPGQPGGVRPAGTQPAAQGVAGAGAVELGSRGPGGNAALTTGGPVLGTKAADAPARVAQVLGKTELTLEQKVKAQKLANASPKARGFVQDLLGVDAEWDQVNSPMTLDEVAKKYGTSRQNVAQTLARLGITEEQLNAARATNLQTVTAEDLGLTQTDRAEGAESQATGFRVSTKEGAGADDFELDARTVRQQKETDAFLKANDTGQLAVIDEAKTEREAEMTRRNQERAVRGLIAWLDDPRNADNVRASGVDWDDAKSDNHPSYNQLPMHVRALWARDYLAQIEETGNEWAPIQQAFDEFAAERADQLAAAQDSVADAGTGQPRVTGPAEQAGGGVRRGEADEDVSWGGEAAQMSRDTQRDGDTTYHTAESLEDSLLSFMNEDALGKRVVIVETAADLKSADDIMAAFDDTAVAWARNGRAYLIADRIPVGKERGVFLHEVGGHLGLERLLGDKEYSRLVGKLVGWAARNDDSQESTLARKAKERVDQAGTEGAEARNAELVAYFLEEAVNAGLNPTAMQYDTPVRQWLRTLWAAFKVGLRRLGVSIDKLTAQDVVNLGYGAARITITGRFHGTAADVQQFRTKYIGTGEGAQAYGWGLYFSELRNVAEEYKKSDVKRKGRSSEYQYAGNPIYGDAQRNVVELATTDFAGRPDAIPRALAKHKADMAKMVADYEALVAESRAAIIRATETKKPVAQLMADMRDDLINLQNARALLKDVEQLDAQKFTGGAAVPPKGNLYATDIAVKPDEFLDWTKPVDDQSSLVKERLDKLFPQMFDPDTYGAEYFRKMTGGQAYRDLEVWFEEARQGELDGRAEIQSYADANPDMKPAELASRYLDSIGIKGVRMPVNYTRGGTYDEGRNFVVFNEKNVIKALDNPASRVSKSIQFSKSVPPQAADQLAAAQAKVTESLSPKAKSAWTDARDFFKRNAPYWLTNFQIAEQWGDKIESLKAYVKVADMMRMETTKQQMAFDAIATRWDSLPKAARAALDEITQRATLREMHPDLPFTHKDNAHLKGRDGAEAEHAALAARYKQMENAHPAAAKVYQEAKAALEASRQRMVEASNKLYADYGIKKTVPDEMVGPYFPLMRFGEYLAIGESEAYKTLADELAQTPPGDARAALQKRLDAMKRDPKHYIVSAHESRSGMERARDQYAKQGLEARVAMADQRLDALPKDVHKMVSQLATQMADKFDGATATAFIDEYKALLIKALPELHALNRAAERKGVEGASPDMLRAFAAAGRQNAFYTARLMYAKDSAQTMQDMKGEVKGNTDLTHVQREMEKRAALDLQFKDTPLQDLAGTASWVYYLGASPTFLFMNTTQPWLVTGPVLAGKYGFAKTTKALGQASREALQVLKDARWKDGKWSPWEGISESSVATTRKNAEGVSEDRKALRELMQRGIVDEGLQHELATFAEGGNRTLAKFGRWTGWASQQIELVNRTATALATFRLARERGMTYEQAVDEAYRVTTNTQMDYSAEGTARFMREGGGIPLAKLLFQFRRYQQTMLYVLGDNIKKLSNPAEREVAAKSLAYFAMTSGLAAGAMGLPFAGTIMMLANAFMDDDDERGDAKTRLRNLLFDLTGDRGMADVLAKGIPAAFGADLSARIGLGDIAQLYPRLELNGKTGEENVGKLAASVLGPSAGLATQFFQAGIHFTNGDWAKGTEKMVPKMAADVLRAARYETQGMTDGKGETILGPEEIAAWDKLLRALGTTSTNEANYYEGTKAKRGIETAINGRKSQIQREFRRAMRSGDFEDVRAMIEEFNADHPDARIKPKDELAWRRDARRSAGQRDETGIQFNPKRDAQLGEVMRFARG